MSSMLQGYTADKSDSTFEVLRLKLPSPPSGTSFLNLTENYLALWYPRKRYLVDSDHFQMGSLHDGQDCMMFTPRPVYQALRVTLSVFGGYSWSTSHTTGA